MLDVLQLPASVTQLDQDALQLREEFLLVRHRRSRSREFLVDKLDDLACRRRMNPVVTDLAAILRRVLSQRGQKRSQPPPYALSLPVVACGGLEHAVEPVQFVVDDGPLG